MKKKFGKPTANVHTRQLVVLLPTYIVTTYVLALALSKSFVNIGSWSQSYDRVSQRQRSKNLQRHELTSAF
jgi:hypothetical protein